MILSIFSCVYLPSVSVKEISPEYSLEGLMLKWKLQYFDHLIPRSDSLEKIDAGKDWGQEERGTTEDEMVGWHHRLDGHEFEQAPGVGDDREAWRGAVHGITKSRTWLSDWTELIFALVKDLFRFFAHLLIGLFVFLMNLESPLCILDKSCFSETWFVNIFS